MKRLILLATMVAVLASCEKTEIQNEVLTPIGFSSNVGKQTKAIVNDANYLTTQPFGVYAYGHQDDVATTIMNNVEISKTDDKWAATVTNTITTKYYWPNDPTTTINFYAYSPAHNTSNATTTVKNHEKLNGTISHSEENNAGLELKDYIHNNMYVDFMVGTPVIGAKYSDPDGNATGASLTNGTVPVKFNHQLTQLIFKVKTSLDYGESITFTIQEIKLNNIHKKGTYNFTNSSNEGTWTTSLIAENNSYTVFPAKKLSDSAVDGAPSISSDESQTVVKNTVEKTLQTTPITVLPQTLSNTAEFEITYKIQGTGVATETVNKKVKFNDGNATISSAWGINQKIIYVITIGLEEILFQPTIVDWDSDLNNNGNEDDDINVNITQ